MSIGKMYENHADKVYKFFYIKSLDRSTAEDLTSETFVRFLKQSDGRVIEDEKKYLYGIMRVVWIEFLKEKYTVAVVEVEGIEDFEQYADDYISDFEEVDSTPAERLRPFIASLPDKQKQVLTLRVYDNQSVKETAATLGKDSNYVKTTYQRALRSLRLMMRAPYEKEV